MLALYLYQI